jgi:hypothetical protein
MSYAFSPLPGPDDPFGLRDLLWCGLCDVVMVPVHIVDSESVRYYCCSQQSCPRLPVPAEVIENLVWFEYAQLYLIENARDIPEPERGPRLAKALDRVTLGLELFERSYQWQGE